VREAFKAAQLTDRNLDAVICQSLQNGLDYLSSLLNRGSAQFSGAQLQHGITIGFLEIIDLLLVLLADFHRLGP